MPGSTGLLVITNKPKTKYSFHAVTILLFCILQKQLSKQAPYIF